MSSKRPKHPNCNKEEKAIVKLKAKELAETGVPFKEITAERVVFELSQFDWIHEKDQKSIKMIIKHQLGIVSTDQLKLYNSQDIMYVPMAKTVHYNATDAENKNKHYTKFVFAAGNHADFKRVDPDGPTKVDVRIKDDQIPGKSVVTIKTPIMASETLDEKMEEVRRRYHQRITDARAALAAAERTGNRNQIRVAEANYDLITKIRGAELEWLTNEYKVKHDSKDENMAKSVTKIVLDEQVSARSDDIKVTMMGGPKKCAHCVAAAQAEATAAITAYAAHIGGGGAAGVLPLVGNPAGDAAINALNVGGNDAAATAAAVGTVPWPDETDPRVLEVEFIQEGSIDKGARM